MLQNAGAFEVFSPAGYALTLLQGAYIVQKEEVIIRRTSRVDIVSYRCNSGILSCSRLMMACRLRHCQPLVPLKEAAHRETRPPLVRMPYVPMLLTTLSH